MLRNTLNTFITATLIMLLGVSSRVALFKSNSKFSILTNRVGGFKKNKYLPIGKGFFTYLIASFFLLLSFNIYAQPPTCTINVTVTPDSGNQPARVIHDNRVLCIDGPGNYRGTITVLSGGDLVVCGGNVTVVGSVAIMPGGNYWRTPTSGIIGSFVNYGSTSNSNSNCSSPEPEIVDVDAEPEIVDVDESTLERTFASAQTIVPMGNLMGSTSVTWGNDNYDARHPLLKPEETTKSSALRVDLVPAEPRIQQVTTDAPDDEQQPGKPVTVTYTITSRANGPDDYALATSYDDGAAAEANLVDSPTTEILGPDGQPASVNLGATATTGPADPDGTTITVPSDGVVDTAVNGISADDIVVIGQDYSNSYEVKNVADDGNTATITLNDVPPGILLGTRIAEQKTFEVVVNGVALADPTVSGTVSLVVTGTSTDGNQGQAPLAFDVPANPIPRSVDRYVRNLTDPTSNPTDDSDVESTEFVPANDLDPVTYYKTGVSAEQDDEVEILIVLKAGNLEDQTEVMLTDTLSPFVEYIEGSGKVRTADSMESLGGNMLLIVDGGDNRSLLNFTHGNALSVPKNTSAHITYQVKVIGERLGGAE